MVQGERLWVVPSPPLGTWISTTMHGSSPAVVKEDVVDQCVCSAPPNSSTFSYGIKRKEQMLFQECGNPPPQKK